MLSLNQQESGVYTPDDVRLMKQKQDQKHGHKEITNKMLKQYASAVKGKLELTDDLKRLQAEFENYKKRCERDNKIEIKKGIAGFVAKLLPIIDSLEHAMKQDAGIKIIYSQLYSLLEQEGLKKISTEKFDPYIHEVMIAEETQKKEDDHKIIKVFQTGYMLKEIVLRPAKVKIQKVQDVRPEQDNRKTKA